MNKILYVGVLILTLLAFNNDTEKISVRYSVKDWNSKLQLLQTASRVIDVSNIDASVRIPLRDSLSKLRQELFVQLQAELAPKNSK